MKPRRIRLECEALEGRLTPAKLVSYNGWTGALTIDGTSGIDKVTITQSANTVKVSTNLAGTIKSYSYSSGALSSIVFHGYDGNDYLKNSTSLPTVAYGGAGTDRFYGGSSTDVFYGGSGNDTLVGNNGSDSLYGMDGIDTLDGGVGNDKLYGGNRTDKLIDSSGSNTKSETSNGIVIGWLMKAEEKVISNSLSVLEREIYGLTNYERERRGLALLDLNTRLMSGAQHHARNMAKYKQMAHELPQADLKTPGDRIAYYGYQYSLYAENVAAGYPDAKQVMNGWMNSSGHRANILNPNIREIGVGVRMSGSYPYYCQLFGTPR